MSGRNSVPGRSVTSKAFTILEAFTGERLELSMSEIARATGLPSSTVHRLIQDLVNWGGLERTVDGRYSVGIRLWEIAARSTRTYGLRETAMPFLQSLWEVTRAHILLAVVDGGEALLIEKITGTKDVPPVGRAGGRLPLHASAVGKVLLAHSGAELQEVVLSGPLTRYTRATIVAPEALRLELARVRRTGVATSEDELAPGSTSCAAPVIGPAGVGIAAISILGTTGARDLRAMKMLVQTAGRGLTHALAGTGPRQPISPRLPRAAPG
jgi:DNA-binding IclR family transcriptional regulator